MSKKSKIIFVILVILLAAASRLIKHPYNFTPIIAMSLFAGCYLRRRWAIILPLGAMLVSDYFIGFYDWQVMLSVYVSIALVFGIGWILKKYKKWYNITLSALISSLAFFSLLILRFGLSLIGIPIRGQALSIVSLWPYLFFAIA